MPVTHPGPAPQPSRRTPAPAAVVPLRRVLQGTTAALGLALALAGCGGPGGNEELVGTSTPSAAVTAEATSIFQLAPGQCFDRPAEDGLYEVAVVPCEVAHDLQMYALFQLDEPTWPGAEAVHALADAGCREQFAAFTGADPAESDLGYTMYTPSEGSWSEGDRQVQCALQLNSGGRMIGSQTASG
ncbi:septum formation family protein [Citricoccus nitrophenolicus]|uniref:Putative regulator of septum formation n=1 Tax=Citricoccus muralis TaxID=169134 RepID=A0A3D9LGR0_9MICC|nr:septum formation family protein [Citricoccus muralis]REE04844.1 putative regulator of septum formation [Citricoccus muralis]